MPNQQQSNRTEGEKAKYDWYGGHPELKQARQNQTPPSGDWLIWLILAGRGFGKTRSGAEYIRWAVEEGIMGRVALVAPTEGDARDVMVEGESGILNISPPWFMPKFNRSARRLTWPNGAIATTYSAERPDRLRGPQHDGAWGDELASWADMATWDNLMFGLRLGKKPRCVVTTTPRPIQIIKDLIAASSTAVTTGSTYDNKANLPKSFFDQIAKKYEGTRLGLQELYAKILDDIEGALWSQELILRAHMLGRPTDPRDRPARLGAFVPPVGRPATDGSPFPVRSGLR